MRSQLSGRLLTGVVFCLAAGAEQPPMAPKELARSIDRQGPGPVLKKLNSGSGAQWTRVLHRIDLGSADWLTVAQKLLPATDAGNSEDLRIALAVALTHNASGVLSLVGPNLPLNKVCTVPFIEPSPKLVEAHRAKVKASLETVTSPELAARKQECLAAIQR